MKKIVAAALLSLVTGSTSLLFPQVAKADRVIYCHHPIIDFNFGFGRRYYGWGRYGRW